MNAGAALLGGLLGLAAWLLVAYGCHLVWPRRFSFNPLYFLGAAFTIETTAAYSAGLAMATLVSEAYALLIGALVFGFDAADQAWLVGLLAGAALSVVSGATLAYSDLLHPGVRSGLISAPGPMALRHDKWGVVALVAWHGVFGLVAGTVYGLLV